MMFEALHYSDVEDALNDIDVVRQQVEKTGAVVLRGLLSPPRIRNALENVKQQFDVRNDLRKTPPFTISTKNYQRLDIGTYGQRELYRFLRLFYYFSWNGDAIGLKDEFVTMTRIRNALSGVDQYLGLQFDQENSDFCYALVVNHYPSGGGFMGAHNDPPYGAHEGRFTKNFPVAMPMTKIGQDFMTGGGWLAPQGERVSWEEAVEIGDMLVYDQDCLHGVGPVDKFEPFDLASLNGRCIGYPSPTRITV